MRNQAQAVVIGGGVVGVSTLYHLARKGWSDVMLLERRDLTSGSTWHAAGLLPLFNMSYSVGQLHKYSVRFYQELQEETGQDVGFRKVSNIRLAHTRDQMDEYHHYAGIAQTIGVDTRFLSPAEIAETWPLCNTDGLIGAIQHPEDGYIQPADLTQALAKGARAYGAEIHQQTCVIGLRQMSDDSWVVETDKGEIACTHVIFCTGNHARQTGAMVGLDIPVIPVQHQYIITEPHPLLLERKQSGAAELGVLREPEASYYLREERSGFLLGPYEIDAPCCYVDGPDPAAEYELFQEDLDRLEPHIEACIKRVPAFGEVGVKKVYNGAIAYTPDGNPIVGPAWDRRNLWLNEGHSFGITAAGGSGWQLAEWIVEGYPTVDMLGVDPRRYGPYATRGYLLRKNEEAYSNIFTIHFPDEERAAARPLRMAPCHDRLKALGAVFGQKFGWERANWFAPEDVEPRDIWSFRRSNYFEPVGAECRAVQNQAGLLDMSAFSKMLVSGPGAEAWLDRLLANRLPKKIGRIGLCHGLELNGGVRSEFTVMRDGAEQFYLVSAGGFERFDHDWLYKQAPRDGSVRLERVTTQYGVLVLAGPESRKILQQLTNTDLSNAAFPWLTGQEICVGMAPVRAMRVNFVGELGWELHHPIEYQNHLFDALMAAGKSYGLRPFGIRAMDSMRLEKSYRMIGTELSIEYSALESGLHRFVQLNKGDFIGRDGLADWQQRGFRWGFVTLEVNNVTDTDPHGSEPIYLGDKVVGRATGGGYGWRIGKSLALAVIESELAVEGAELEIEILGIRKPVRVLAESPYDPENIRLRA